MELNNEMHLTDLNTEKLQKIPTREGFGRALVELGELHQDVVVLTADVAESVRVHYFAEKFPFRFIQCGVAEQNMAGVAAGLAYEGKVPFMAAYGVFNTGRNFDQIRVAICYAEANVKVAASHTGLTVGPDGATHQSLEDIALMRTLPNMTIFVPADTLEAYKATMKAYDIHGPVYIRLSREKFPVFTTEKTPFIPGKANVLKEGKDLTFIACGVEVYEALIASKMLSEQGIDASVINLHTLSHKDIDIETIIRYAKSTACIITVEEHQIVGGLGSAVSECLSEHYPVPVKRIGVEMEFGQSGEGYELLEHYGLTSKHIASKAKEFYEKVMKR